MGAKTFLLLAVLLALYSSVSLADDPGPLQDFCVADYSSQVLVNGYACKQQSQSTADDFFMSGFQTPGNTTNQLGLSITPAFAASIPGTNTLGVSMLRIDYAPGGIYPPHSHPRASEIMIVLKGKLEVGFVPAHPDYRLFNKSLNEGDAFVFPQGLIHYQINTGKHPAVAFSGLSSQNPGVIFIPNTLFGSVPKFPTELLVKAFQVDANVISQLEANF